MKKVRYVAPSSDKHSQSINQPNNPSMNTLINQPIQSINHMIIEGRLVSAPLNPSTRTEDILTDRETECFPVLHFSFFHSRSPFHFFLHIVFDFSARPVVLLQYVFQIAVLCPAINAYKISSALHPGDIFLKKIFFIFFRFSFPLNEKKYPLNEKSTHWSTKNTHWSRKKTSVFDCHRLRHGKAKIQAKGAHQAQEHWISGHHVQLSLL